MNTPKIFTIQKSLFSVLTVCLCIWAISMTGCSDSSSSAPEKFQTEAFVLDEFQNLLDYIGGLTTELSDEQRNNLFSKISDARDAYENGNPCEAADILSDYLDLAQGLRQDELVAIAEDLHNRGYLLNYNMLTSLLETCEGYEKFGMPPEVLISDSNNIHLTARFTFGKIKMWTVEDGGEVFTQVQPPGVANPIGAPGMPAVPLYRKLIAVPRGAEVQITGTAHEGKTIYLNLYPVQTQPMDSDEEDPPFVKDADVYGTNDSFPGKALSVRSLGYIRDVHVAEITCATGQHNPSTDTFTLYDSVDFEVTYTDGTGVFLTEASRSPFDNTISMMDGLVMNSDILVDYIGPDDNDNRIIDGEELLILSHPDFLPAADRLADFKNEQGIITRVCAVNDGIDPGPDTAEEIDALIEYDYDVCLIRPSYVLLLGDAEFIPTFYVEDYRSPDRPHIGSDYPYAAHGQGLFFMFPDIGIGRIPVDTIDEANAVVDKIIAYENTPPEAASFYENATMVSQFQCCRGEHTGWDQRTFVEVSEFTRDVLLNHGYTVERIYTKTGDSTPQRYFDGTHLPADLGDYSGFPWDGDTGNIIDAFTAPEGRFLIMHRDHGSAEGWIHPSFTVDNILDDLDEQDPALLPVVFSINCSSGMFDNETCPAGECNFTYSNGIYFCEALLRKADGGAVGVFGATRGSPSWPNTYLTKGMIDAIWPDAIPDFGGDTPQRRLGDILNYGKLYMLGQMGAYMDVLSEILPGHEDMAIADTLNDYNLTHCFGDPTLEIWTAPPGGLPQDVVMQDTADGVRVDYAVDGAIVTVYQKTADGVVALGRGTIENGQADISYIQEPSEGYPIQVSVNKAGYVAGVLTPTSKMITAGAGAGGSISPSGSVTVDYGSDQAFTITPNTGYGVADVLVDSVSQGAVSSYTFENVTADHTITATFTLRTFTITATAGENGTIDPSGDTTVGYGSDQVYTFTPADGYEVDTVTVDGQATEVTGNNYTFMNVVDDHTIDVTFRVLVEETAWSKTYGHADWYCEYHTYGLDVTDDGGYVFAAESQYDASGGWETDFWVVKLDADGNIQWEKRFGGESIDYPESVLQTADGGYIVAGKSYSYRTGTHYCDMWVIKLNSSGGIEWEKTYGDTGYDVPMDLQETFDSQGASTGYILAGYTTSFGAGGRDVWVLKLSNSGGIDWEQTYGGTGNEFGRAIRQVFDQGGNPDGYVMAADTTSFGAGDRDVWVLKLSNSGTVEWEKTYGDSGLEIPQSIQVASDGGYVVGARTDSFGAGENDFWALKLDADGNLVWQYTYGGLNTDTAQDLEKTADGGYIMTGWTLSFDVDSFDAWVVKLTDAGLIQWQKSYNVNYTYSGDEWAYEVAQAADGGYAIAGDSDAGDDRSSDVWIFKVDSAGSLGCGIETDTDAVPNGNAQVTVTEQNTYTVSDTSANVQDTDCTSYDTAADVFTQCSP